MRPVAVYLVTYNVVQFLGWSRLLFLAVKAIALDGKCPRDIYTSLSFELKIFQTLAILEVVNSACGIVRSPPIVTAMQVASRLMLVWPVTHLVDEAQHSIGVLIYVLAWSITEIIRYSFYALSVMHRAPAALLWARYTFFIVLYPMGVVGELLTVIAALPGVKQRKILSLEMPNKANISFDYYYGLWIFMLMYLPFFPQLYCYMWSQRAKVLKPKTA